MKSLSAILLFIIPIWFFGQNFNGILLNRNDSSVLAYTAIKLKETGKYTSTNSKGEFNFAISPEATELHFDISLIGCHTSLKVNVTKNKVNKVFIECASLALKDVTVIGLTAKDIVEKAVASIKLNYYDSSYASASFYRQYQKVNGKFRNLIETQAVVLFSLSTSKNDLNSKEALAIEQLRRSNYYKIGALSENYFPDFISQNPVYHIANSSLNPSALNFYTYSFDTTASQGDYLINYTCQKFSSENHGIGNYAEAGIDGEATESGKLTIDMESFAFKKIERVSVRNKGYNYPKNNNFVRPGLKFTEEFAEGNLVAEYMNINNKWYLKKLFHSYTNEFFRTQTYEKTYVLTECFEWYAASVTRQISQDIINKFYFIPDFISTKYVYDKNKWQKILPPFIYFDKETVYKDLEKDAPLDQQFDMNGK